MERRRDGETGGDEATECEETKRRRDGETESRGATKPRSDGEKKRRSGVFGRGGCEVSEVRPKVVLAYSGGLDTTYCAVWLREQGYDVHAVTVQTGGFSADELGRVEAMSRKAGVTEFRVVDARRALFDGTLRYLIFANALRGGVYPLCVSAERLTQARVCAEFARSSGAEALCHGSTGAGNDQVRFDVAFRVFAPGVKVLTPIREQALSREQETTWLRQRGIEIPPKTTAYSVNRGLWGATIGGAETHRSDGVLPESAYVMTAGVGERPKAAEECVIRFEGGVPVGIGKGEAGMGSAEERTGKSGKGTEKKEQGVESSACGLENPHSATGSKPAPRDALDTRPTDFDPVRLIEELNERAGRHGVGRGMHVGDTILGIKGRVAFEAPAAVTLIAAHRELEKLVLSRQQQFWKQTLGELYGSFVHEARFFDPLMRDVEAFLASSQRAVTGEVRVQWFGGQLTVLGATSPYSLMNADIAKYGESSSMWSGTDAAAFCRIYGLQDGLLAAAAGRHSPG